MTSMKISEELFKSIVLYLSDMEIGIKLHKHDDEKKREKKKRKSADAGNDAMSALPMKLPTTFTDFIRVIL